MKIKKVFNTARSLFKMARLLVVFLILAVTIRSSASEVLSATEDSWLPLGLFCFRSGTDTNTQLHLVKYENGKIETVFTTPTSCTVKSPICLTNGVIAVSSDGIIRKLNLKGEFVFTARPKGFEGAAVAS